MLYLLLLIVLAPPAYVAWRGYSARMLYLAHGAGLAVLVLWQWLVFTSWSQDALLNWVLPSSLIVHLDTATAIGGSSASFSWFTNPFLVCIGLALANWSVRSKLGTTYAWAVIASHMGVWYCLNQIIPKVQAYVADTASVGLPLPFILAGIVNLVWISVVFFAAAHGINTWIKQSRAARQARNAD